MARESESTIGNLMFSLTALCIFAAVFQNDYDAFQVGDEFTQSSSARLQVFEDRSSGLHSE
jgi:hypothetical protein